MTIQVNGTVVIDDSRNFINAANVNSIGVVTASSFVGSGAGVTSINASNISSGTLDSDRLPSNISISGIATIGNAKITTLDATTGYINTGVATVLSGTNVTYTTGDFPSLRSAVGIITELSGTNLSYSGIGTIGFATITNACVNGIITATNLEVYNNFNVYSTEATFHGNLRVDGNVSVGGSSFIINAEQLRIEDRDLVLGFTTVGSPSDDTANHAGVAVASTEGYSLVSLQVAGINTFPDTYKQIMWVKHDTMGAGTTDAWLYNHAVGIGSTQVPNSVYLAVGQIQATQNTIISPNLNVSGVGTIGNAKITTLDAPTGYINTGIITNLSGTNLSYSGVGTFSAQLNATNLNVSGVVTSTSFVGDGSLLTGITALASPGGSDGQIQYNNGGITDGASRFYYNDVNNRVGIGTTNPTPTLQVSGNFLSNSSPTLGVATGNFYVTGSDTNYGLLMGNYSGSGNAWLQVQRTDGTATAYNLTLQPSGGNVLVASNTATGTASQPLQVTGGAYFSGAVGFGSTSPSGKVEINGGTTDVGGELNLVVRSSNVSNIPATISQSSSASTLQIFSGGMASGSLRGGQIDFIAGAATTNPGTLIFRTGTASGGTSQSERVRIDASGNVGIGLTNPADALHIRKDDADYTARTIIQATDQRLILGSYWQSGVDQYAFIDSTNDAQSAAQRLEFRTGGVERVRISSSGNVGIGTTNPDAGTKLHCQVDTSQDIRIGVSNQPVISYRNGSGAWFYAGKHDTGDYFEISSGASPSTSTALVATSGGNIGIGTTNPGDKLDVNGNVFIGSISGGAEGGQISLRDKNGGSTNQLNIDVDGANNSRIFQLGNADLNLGNLTGGTGSVKLHTNGNERVRIDSSGNLGIGSITPSAALTIATTGSATHGASQIYLNGLTSNRIDFNSNGVAAPTFTTRSAGVKILLYPSLSASAADYAFGIEASTLWSGVPTTSQQFKWYAGTTNVATLSGAGDFSVTGDVTAYSASDIRLKSNISPIDNPLDKIMKISGIKYNWNELAENKDQNKREIGIIAQEVKEVLPEVVTERENGYLAVQYEKLIPLLIESIKELKKEVDELKNSK